MGRLVRLIDHRSAYWCGIIVLLHHARYTRATTQASHTAPGAAATERLPVLVVARGLGGEEEHTLEQIGQSLGLSRERVRQLEARALKKLRETQPAQRLHPILEP